VPLASRAAASSHGVDIRTRMVGPAGPAGSGGSRSGLLCSAGRTRRPPEYEGLDLVLGVVDNMDAGACGSDGMSVSGHTWVSVGTLFAVVTKTQHCLRRLDALRASRRRSRERFRPMAHDAVASSVMTVIRRDDRRRFDGDFKSNAVQATPSSHGWHRRVEGRVRPGTAAPWSSFTRYGLPSSHTCRRGQHIIMSAKRWRRPRPEHGLRDVNLKRARARRAV
jgi:hypothetical protein